MFDLNRRAIIPRIGRRFRTNMYIPVYHTNRGPFKNMIGVVKNHLVGMGLKNLGLNLGNSSSLLAKETKNTVSE